MTAKQNRWMLLFIFVLAAAAAFVTFYPKIRTYYGLDIKGGVRVVLRADIADYQRKRNKPWTNENLESVRKILENRVNSSGVAEPVIITKPPTQIVIELPGLKDEREALERLQSTARLEFYLLPQLGVVDSDRPATWSYKSNTDPKTNAEVPVLIDNATGKEVTPAQLEEAVFSHDPIVTGEDLLPNSHAVIQPGTGQAIIEFEFNAKGSQIFEDVTRSNIHKHLAIFLDKRLLTAPTINGPIPGRGIIEGSFTLESAKALSDQLNAGALPVPLILDESRKLEATLGAEAVHQTTFAGIIGLIGVLIFMVAYYRLPGLLADVALLLYTIFSIAIFKLYPVTLTLPGIAGFILSIGMAVDANILIFERVKEELRAGKPLKTAIDTGFKRAFSAILDSNVCTIITCIVLFNLGTGSIRGFALTLGLGVAISMFTAITVSRTFLFALVASGIGHNLNLYGLNVQWHPTLNVMKRKALWVGISLLVIIPGMFFWAMGGIKTSIDFRGGTELQVPFASRHSSEQIEKALATLGPQFKDSRVVVSGTDGSSVPAYVTTHQLDDATRQQVVNTLTTQVGPLAANQNVGYSNVSGTVSNELMWDAVKSVLIASGLILLYLALRFSIGGFREGLKYGACAVVALLHDVGVLWGVFAIMGYFARWQIDGLFVTAMLTVIGFSVHDTIVIFDRVRENMGHRERGEGFSHLADRSIDQTFARSINTSVTVLFTLAMLFFLGGSIVHQFSFALLIGIFSGTYSSIFNASVLLVWWKDWDLRKAGPVAAAKAPAAVKSYTPTARTPVPVSEKRTDDEDGSSSSENGEKGQSASRTERPRSAPRKQPARRRRM